LYDYFGDLKNKIDLEYSLEPDEKYFQLIAKVESIEQYYYSKMKPIDLFNKELDSIEKQLEEGMNVNINEELNNKIDLIKYSIERYFLSNKCFIFLNNAEKDKNILIMNDRYLETSFIDEVFIKWLKVCPRN
jgi:hypothetical protein